MRDRIPMGQCACVCVCLHTHAFVLGSEGLWGTRGSRLIPSACPLSPLTLVLLEVPPAVCPPTSCCQAEGWPGSLPKPSRALTAGRCIR